MYRIPGSLLLLLFASVWASAQPSWQQIDQEYLYEGSLGAEYSEQETDFVLWAPLASEVVLNLYESGTSHHAFRTEPMEKGAKGTWKVQIDGDLWGKYYTYSVTNDGQTREVLDPYAKSMAATHRGNFFSGRGAIIDPSRIGPELGFANIQDFKKREDAIIWEINVRDFTSDPDLSTDAPFGTYTAFIEQLDYIKKMGVTHIQLLPVLSSTYSDETRNQERMMEFEVGSNYNWGYGPDNYFSPEGMYSVDPGDPSLRIKELKTLIAAIHENGMGVVLDVVYNHTARLSFFEDIVPGYYHFMDSLGQPKESYGGGRLGTTHGMTRRLVIDSIIYWLNEYKVDGFRFDLMGDLDAQTIQMAWDSAKSINPNVIMVGECWRTYAGDDGDDVTPADQDWMDQTNSVSCFSDEMRNELKSGVGSEGEPRFLTGGPRNIQIIFNNIIAKPGNQTEDDPGDILQYIAAHDDLPLHDVIAYSLKKDPSVYQQEIQRRIRLGNTMLLTSQGLAFIHAGQEYGRTKQWRSSTPPEREFSKIEGLEYPYFIRNSYDASDAVNMFDWDKVMEQGIHRETMEFTRGLIDIRKSTDAFRLGTEELISKKVSLIKSEEINDRDLIIGYLSEATTGERYFTFINADTRKRSISMNVDLTKGTILVDSDEASKEGVTEVTGVEMDAKGITIAPLTPVMIRLD